MDGILTIIGTPIGNREDITLRALKALFSVDLLLCEDTRVTGKLLGMYMGVNLPSERPEAEASSLSWGEHKPELVRFDEHAEKLKLIQVIRWLKEGKRVGLVSDAGMPLISDPGYLLVKRCHEEGIKVEVVPGPSALDAALAVSGLPINRVLFLGFLPKKTGKRQEIWARVKANSETTIVIYESPYRLKDTLSEIQQELGEVEMTACGELTKMHEKVIRGTVGEVIGKLPEVVKGEWVVVVKFA